jgi:hypothetical protein
MTVSPCNVIQKIIIFSLLFLVPYLFNNCEEHKYVTVITYSSISYQKQPKISQMGILHIGLIIITYVKCKNILGQVHCVHEMLGLHLLKVSC